MKRSGMAVPSTALLGIPIKARKDTMQIEIWDRETASGETVTMLCVNGTATQHAHHEAAFEYLRGQVRELQAAIDTAIVMYLRQPNAANQARSDSK